MNRRSFVQLSASGLVGVTLPVRWPAAGRGKVLVWLELNGGNDGLNTVIPYRDVLYQRARPTLAMADGPLLSRELILHPALSPLQPLWAQRRLAFALGVGWPEPTRSHFRAMDQWATASRSGSSTGWLAAVTDRRGSGRPLVALGPSGSRALEGGRAPSLQIGPRPLAARAPDLLLPARAGANATLRQMLEIEAVGEQQLQRLLSALAPLPQGIALPAGSLGQQIGLALRLIGSEAPPAALQLAQGGYDTHSNQATGHPRALQELAAALVAFDRGLQQLSRRPQVTLLVTSEFGRRFAENQSQGTDHGSASVAFVLGDHVPHPFIGTYPSLSQRDDRGDLIPNLTIQQLYSQVEAL